MHHGIAEATVYEVPSFIAQTCIKRSLSDEVYQIWFWGNDSTINVNRIAVLKIGYNHNRIIGSKTEKIKYIDI